MRKSLAAAMAAITFGGAVVAAAAPAEAQRYGHGGHDGGHYNNYDRHRGDNGGAAIAAGVVGLALGAALASNSNHSYGSYYNRGYYAPQPYAYGYGGYDYGVCEREHWVWDPYIGRRVLVRSRYAC